jgi:hypothetical protein
LALVRKGEFAKAKGVTPAAVTFAIRSGRLSGAVVTENGREMIDLDLGLELWDRNTARNNNAKVGAADGRTAGPAQRRRTPPVAVAAPAAAPPMDQLRAYIEALPEDAIPDLNESRARREHYQAEKAKLEALQGRGELVPVAEVRAEAFNLARSIRESMMAIPARLAPMVAGTADTRQCHHLIEQELRIALRVLSDG